jgi:hypothetical protein
MTAERQHIDKASRGTGETGIEDRGLDREGILKETDSSGEGISAETCHFLQLAPARPNEAK